MTHLISVLLVDDNPTFLSITTEFLRNHTDLVIVGTATEGHQALNLVSQVLPDIVLLDLSMADLPGLQVIPRLRRIFPNIGIIVLTLHEGEHYHRQAIAAGANDFINKSNMYTDLVASIRRVGRGLV